MHELQYQIIKSGSESKPFHMHSLLGKRSKGAHHAITAIETVTVTVATYT